MVASQSSGALQNIKFQAPNYKQISNIKVPGVPPEADQVSGKKNKILKPPAVRHLSQQSHSTLTSLSEP